MSQAEAILQHLKAGGTLTVSEALIGFGCYALSQRIGDLKRDGHPIKAERVDVGNGKRVARYSYDAKPKIAREVLHDNEALHLILKANGQEPA
jgi:hypothetical protein